MIPKEEIDTVSRKGGYERFALIDLANKMR